ncbi:MAG: nucleotidyltransferase family protein [Nanoarchaeota archaeon]|mgnify:FL=1
MAYTEIKQRNENQYFYRVISVRNNNEIGKKRIYLGLNLEKEELKSKEIKADKELIKIKINKNIDKIKPKILSVLKKYKIKKASIFGSYARGENKKSSDIDILIEQSKGMGLEFVGLALDLEDALKRKVDLVSYGGIHPLIRKNILKDKKVILNG